VVEQRVAALTAERPGSAYDDRPEARWLREALDAVISGERPLALA